MEGHSDTPPRLESVCRIDLQTELSIPPIQTLLDLAEATSAPKPAKPQGRDPVITVDGLPLKTYILDNMPYTMQHPADESYNSATRRTIDGRTLEYKLHVIQQPQRARACGAGARSSADRRPVDPPPVVELRIFEIGKEITDITYSYNAGFFLFATLEVSRPIAAGRINNTPVIPVLTGVPVAATNYLDRPAPAGYFIFPDLSVRHEGWYRLVFNLYEATKDPEDADVDRPFKPVEANTAPSTDPRAPHPHENMALRLEVRSTPFQVYSAKKFPGLSESTTLSRLVAEQGCRVRIRRDVRMRKRVDGRKDDAEILDDGHHSRHDTPESYHPYTPNVDRPRSISRSSMDGSQYSSDHYRRTSMENGYQGHVYQTATTPGSSGPVYSSGYPTNILTTPPVGTSTPQYSSYPQPTPITASTASHQQFAVPQPRLSQDRAFEGINHSSVQRFDQKQYWEQPKIKAMPRATTPEPYASGVEVSNMLAPLRDRPHTPRQLNVNAGLSRWDIPEPTASKHRLSPPTLHAQMKPLKAGMRPETEQSVKHWSADSMEPDRNLYGHEDDSVFDEPNSISIPYRRADGKTVLKRIPNPEALPAAR